jgi:HPt (histidine-containing phosphotransfer) domain-containing protein
VLDAGAIAKLRELDPGGRAGLVARVVSTYAASLDRLLAQLGAARRASDATALRHVAHTLKSSSASVGAQTLAGLCAEVEALLRDGPGDGLELRLDELAAEAARVLAAVKTEGAA